MSDQDYQRKHELECLRLAADSMQLASEIGNPEWQAHFLRGGSFWTARAEQSLNADANRTEGTVLTGTLSA